MEQLLPGILQISATGNKNSGRVWIHNFNVLPKVTLITYTHNSLQLFTRDPGNSIPKCAWKGRSWGDLEYLAGCRNKDHGNILEPRKLKKEKEKSG
jgi:hypothetical protein